MRALHQSQLGRTLSALALFSVVGCSRIVSPGGSAGGNTLSGIVQLARVSGATISVFEMQSDGSKGPLLASTTTNSNGDYTVNLGKYSGHVIIESVGGSYSDEATGATKTASLLSAISEASSATNAPVTPMSTLVKERTLALLATSSLSEAKTQAVSEVAGLFGVSAEDLLVIPTSATALSSLNTRATRAALGLAAFSYFLKDFRHADSEVSVDDALSALAEDLKDDGQINGSTSSTVAKKLAMEWRASMAAAKTAASANSNLVFSKLSSEILAEVSSTTLDTGSELDGLQEDGSFYINGVNTGLQGGTGLFIEKYYYLGGLAQVENGPMEDGYYYKDGEKANEPIGGINYANGELANGVAGSGQMYFYANGKLIGTYDGSMASNGYGTVTFTTVPDATFSYNGYLNFVLTDIHLSAGATLTTNGTITFNGSSNNYGTVNGGETTFNDSALNIGTITGTVTFNDNSRNYMDGIVGTGNATFNDSSYNFGTVGGNATFNNSSFQYGWVGGNVTLNDSSTTGGDVGGAITDNRIASCNDDCYLEGSSPTYAQGLNLGTKRQGPGGTILTLQYANGSSGFKIWKEDNGNRILNATGLIANGWQKMLVSAGTAFSASDFTAGSNIAGRVCPTHVFLNHDNMTATNRCVYYDEGNTAQTLDADSSTGQEGLDWLTEWIVSLPGKDRLHLIMKAILIRVLIKA